MTHDEKGVSMMANYVIQHFAYKNLRIELPEVSEPFVALARAMDELLDEGPEKTICLRKLLEACDNAMRARMLDVDNHYRDERIEEVKQVLYPQGGAHINS